MSAEPKPISPEAVRALAYIIADWIGPGVVSERAAEAILAAGWVSPEEVVAREVAARREALLEAADAWDNADPRDLDYLARRFYRAGGPSTPTIWLRRRAEALAEPERDEESGR